jgi:two-component system, NarL family, sensor histidine kinase UhpB
VGAVDPAVLRAGMGLLGFHWTYSVPLLVEGRVAGAIAFHFADRPGDTVLAVADVFAAQAALTVANDLLGAAMRERATELAGSRARLAAAEERVRRDVAESLHGRVQSRLLVVSHRLLEARAMVASDVEGTGAELEALAAELDRIREADLARAIDQLHPAIVSVGLMAALRHLAAEMSPRLDVTVTADPATEALDDPRHGRIPEAVRLEVYRTVEEALANVARHAGTDAAAVRVELSADTLRTTVSDEGRGYDPAAARDGVGLRSMRDRAGRLGGTVAIDGAPGRGTKVTLALPLRRG